MATKPMPVVGQVWQERDYAQRKIRITASHTHDMDPPHVSGVVTEHPRSPARVGAQVTMTLSTLHAGWTLLKEAESVLERQKARREALAEVIGSRLPQGIQESGVLSFDIADAVLAALPTLDKLTPA